MSAAFLTQRQQRTLERIGNIYCPETKQLPSFASVGAALEADRILKFMPLSDLADLKSLLNLLSILPTPALILFIYLLEACMRLPIAMGSIVRLMRFGLRGLVFSLYYGHPKVHQVLGYTVSVYTDDLDPKKKALNPSKSKEISAIL